MATALELIRDLDGLARPGPSEPTCGARPAAAAPRTRRVQRSSSRWSRRPSPRVPPRACRSHRNAPPRVDCHCPSTSTVLCADRRLEVLPPLRLTVVAVRPRVGENVHAAVADLHRQGVGVCVRGDGQEPVRPAVAAAPYLGRVGRRPFAGS